MERQGKRLSYLISVIFYTYAEVKPRSRRRTFKHQKVFGKRKWTY
jgi:hypothetical protein